MLNVPSKEVQSRPIHEGKGSSRAGSRLSFRRLFVAKITLSHRSEGSVAASTQ
jgi:hypothetical protein